MIKKGEGEKEPEEEGITGRYNSAAFGAGWIVLTLAPDSSISSADFPDRFFQFADTERFGKGFFKSVGRVIGHHRIVGITA